MEKQKLPPLFLFLVLFPLVLGTVAFLLVVVGNQLGALPLPALKVPNQYLLGAFSFLLLGWGVVVGLLRQREWAKKMLAVFALLFLAATIHSMVEILSWNLGQLAFLDPLLLARGLTASFLINLLWAGGLLYFAVSPPLSRSNQA